MNPDQLNERLLGLKEGLVGFFPGEIATCAQDGLVQMVQRIVETGKDVNGQQFKPYTPAYERHKRGAVGTAKKEGAKARANRFAAQATGEKPIGRFTGFRNFTLSGQMLSSIGVGEGPGDRFRNIGVLTTTQDATKTTVIIGPRDQHTRDKMEGNDNVTPGWYHVAPKEIELAKGDSRERLYNFARKFLG